MDTASNVTSHHVCNGLGRWVRIHKIAHNRIEVSLGLKLLLTAKIIYIDVFYFLQSTLFFREKITKIKKNWLDSWLTHVTLQLRDDSCWFCVFLLIKMMEPLYLDTTGTSVPELWFAKVAKYPFGVFLKGHCHEDFAVLGQFCAKIITLRL